MGFLLFIRLRAQGRNHAEKFNLIVIGRGLGRELKQHFRAEVDVRLLVFFSTLKVAFTSGGRSPAVVAFPDQPRKPALRYGYW